jgi:hypothetical protein
VLVGAVATQEKTQRPKLLESLFPVLFAKLKALATQPPFAPGGIVQGRKGPGNPLYLILFENERLASLIVMGYEAL